MSNCFVFLNEFGYQKLGKRHYRVNFLSPATRMQSFTWVWQHLVCRAIKSHSHPCKAKWTAQGANHIYHLEAIRPIAGWKGRELAALISVCSIPRTASVVWNTREDKTKRLNPSRQSENGKGSLRGCQDKVTLVCGVHLPKNDCFVSVNSLCSTCIAKGGSRRGGRGGGAGTGGNVASSNEIVPFLASSSLLQLTSDPCVLYIKVCMHR